MIKQKNMGLSMGIYKNEEGILLIYTLVGIFVLLLSILLLTSFNLIAEKVGSVSNNDKGNIKILFTGDFMFDRYIRQTAQNKGVDFVIGDFKEMFNSYDFIVADLEGPITNYDSISIGSVMGSSENFVFTFDPSVAGVLGEYNMRVVNIGNNHILNFGVEGLNETKTFLDEVGIKYFGYTGVTKGSESYLIREINGIKIGFVNYNQFVSGGIEKAFEDVKKTKNESDLVVLYAHWGPEYVTVAPQSIQDLAHRFVDNGADLIIGSHPHVIQQTETYKGKKIYYSLGNFVMDQYFSEETMRGMLVEVYINKKGELVDFKEFYVKSEPVGRIRLLDAPSL